MAFNSHDLSVLAYANGFTLWHYATEDNSSVVDTEGYFNPASEMMRVGDFVLANVGTGGSPRHGLFVVLSNAGSQVDVGDIVAVGSVDTD